MRRQVGTVFRKEMRDHLRDRRSLLTVMMLPVLGPLMTLLTLQMVASMMRRDQPVELAVVGREHAPSLMSFLERQGAILKEAPQDYEARIRDGALDMVLVVPEDYGRDFSRAHTAEVRLVADSSRRAAIVPVQRARRLLEAYSGHVGSQRLFARGVSPELAMAVRVADADLATPAQSAAQWLNMVPLFLVMVTFAGGLQLASDALAGERERGSLEPLLLNPAPRGVVVLGKWAATVVMSVLATVVTMMGFVLALKRAPLEDLGVTVHPDAAFIGVMLLTVLPLTLAASAAQMWVSTYARSFKEAQLYLNLLMIVPMAPGVVLSLMPMKSELWMFAVPVLGQELLAGEVLRGEMLRPLPFLIATASSVAVALVALRAVTRLLGDERIVFGRS
ncbi:ABC transporter permease [Myxococcus landrumensis]|uniref:ABC transporter permease n=1 Tax=Myxococcus landrumensis TaxID=2813577 RepID=A0ABX7N1K6_9BACT|nr:ABC transporter permease [Myxococcus landrumus]QSQ12600.1 ABC transporter permease [Myxococcus landrumus]